METNSEDINIRNLYKGT